jgi:hypothetical protein
MILNRGYGALDVRRVIHTANPRKGYVLWVGGAFTPTLPTLVRADSFDDAYDEYLCDERVEQLVKLDDDDLAQQRTDYGEDWTTWPAAYMNDNGVLCDTDWVEGFALSE